MCSAAGRTGERRGEQLNLYKNAESKNSNSQRISPLCSVFSGRTSGYRVEKVFNLNFIYFVDPL